MTELITDYQVFPGRGGSAAAIEMVTSGFFTGGVCDGLTPVHRPDDPLELFYGGVSGEVVMARAFARAIRRSGVEPLKQVAQQANANIQLVHETVMDLKGDEPASNLYGLSAILFRITPAWLTFMCWGDVRCFAKIRDGRFWASPDLQSEHEAEMYRLVDKCFERASAELGISRTVTEPAQRKQLQDRMWEYFTPLLREARDKRINSDEGYPVLNGHPEAVERCQMIKLRTSTFEVIAVLDDGIYEYCGRTQFAALFNEAQAENNIKFIEERGLHGQVAFLDDQDAAATEVSHVRGKKDRAGIYFRFA